MYPFKRRQSPFNLFLFALLPAIAFPLLVVWAGTISFHYFVLAILLFDIPSKPLNKRSFTQLRDLGLPFFLTLDRHLVWPDFS